MSCFSLLLAAQVRKAPAESAIQQVTIFSSGAQVQRTASVAVLTGRSEVVFAGLSNQMDPQSVQLKADANITLLSVQATKDFFGERKVEQEEKSLLEKSAALKNKIDLDNRLLEVYRQEEAMVVKNQSIGGTTGVKAAELQAALDLQRARLTELYQKQLEVQKRIQAAQQEAVRTRLQITEISKKKDSVNYAVTAVIDSKETRSIRFTLTYTVKDAGWYPTYDVRIAEVAKPVEMIMSANVFQRSGETWKDVALLLSTGNPTDNATPSQLQPWMLGYYDPNTAYMRSSAVQPGVVMGRITDENGNPAPYTSVTVQGTAQTVVADGNGYFKMQNLPANAVLVFTAVGYKSKSISARPGYYSIKIERVESALQEVVVTAMGTDDMLEDKAAGMNIRSAGVAKKAEEIQLVPVATGYTPTTTMYEIKDKYTLETDGKTTTINIRKLDVPALYTYYAGPKIDPSAYLTAQVVDWQELELQPGEAALYFEGSYLGKTYLDLASAGDTLSLALGKDNNIRIQRKLVKAFSAKKFIGSNRTETKTFEIIVRNNKRTPVTLLLQDQFPVSTNKEIEIDDKTAPGASVDKETGLVNWNLALAPGEEKKLGLGYSVRYPKDKKVVLE